MQNCKWHYYKEHSISLSYGKYTAKLQWKYHPALLNNYKITKKRTQSAIHRLSKEPRLLQKYGDEQEKPKLHWECGGHSHIESHTLYSPPRREERKGSTTTPIRKVYGCSWRASSGSPSLNDCSESAPPELNNHTMLLMRIRLGNINCVCRHRKVIFERCSSRRRQRRDLMFGLSDPAELDSKLLTYRFRPVLFGASCWPYILNATPLKHVNLNTSNQQLP